MEQTIEELEQTATERMQGMVDALATNDGHVASLTEQLEEFESSLAQKETESLAALEELNASIFSAEDQLNSVSQGLSGLIDSTQQQVARLEDQVTALSEGVEQALAELQEHVEQLQQESDECREEYITQADLANEAVETANLRAASQVAQCLEGVEEVKAQVEQGASALEAATESLDATSEEFGEFCRTTLADVVDKTQTAMERLEENKESLVERIGECVADCSREMSDQLLSRALSAFSDNVDQAGAALGEVQNCVAQLNENFDGEVGDVLERLESITDVIEDIKPVLEMVQQTLG